MGKFGTGLLTVALGAAGGAAYLAYRISQETGKSLTDAFAEVPGQAGQYWEEVRARGMEAVEAGREAARQKQSEMEQQLRDQSHDPSS